MKEWGFWKRLTFTIVQQCDRENRHPRFYLWAPNLTQDGSGFDSCRISLHHAEATLWVDLVQKCVREPLLRFPVKKIQNNLIIRVLKSDFSVSLRVWYWVVNHFEFLEYWNTQKSVWWIWQRFSCLLDEGIPKIWKKLNSHDGFLSCLQNSTANSAHLAAHLQPALVCPQKATVKIQFLPYFWNHLIK